MRSLLALLSCLILLACVGPAQVGPGQVPSGPDGWSMVSPEAVGFDADALRKLEAAFERGDYPNLHAVLVEHDGQIVFEKYLAGDDESWGRQIGYREFDQNALHDLRSVSKSVTSLLLGIALGDDFARELSRPVIEYFPELAGQVAPGFEAITLHHLLTMSSGLEWNEMESPYSNPENDGIKMYRSGDPVTYTLTRPLVATPGSRWYYSGGTTMVLAVLVEKISGRPFLEFAHEMLFEPLGIDAKNVEWRGQGSFWRRDPRLPAASSGLRLRARDLARIGSMVLHGGQWRGRQIVPRGWIETSLQRHVDRHVRWDLDGIYGYGYQWWHGEFHGNWGRFTAICAIGFGSQRLCVVPAKKLVVTVFAGNYGTGGRTVSDRVLAAVVATAP